MGKKLGTFFIITMSLGYLGTMSYFLYRAQEREKNPKFHKGLVSSKKYELRDYSSGDGAASISAAGSYQYYLTLRCNNGADSITVEVEKDLYNSVRHGQDSAIVRTGAANRIIQINNIPTAEFLARKKQK
jgi:hypothetical protein